MISEENLIELGYELVSTDKNPKINNNFYKIEGRKYQVCLTDDGILSISFPINFKSNYKSLNKSNNTSDLSKFEEWHNNYKE